MPRRRTRKRQYGTGTIVQVGQTWAIRWREGGRRRYRGGYESKEQAEKVRAQIALNVRADRDGLPPDAAEVGTLAELAEDWLEERETTRPKNHAKDKGRWTLHLEPALGHLTPQAIDAETIRRLIVAKRTAGLSTTTVRHIVHLLSALLTRLVQKRVLTVNPVRLLPESTWALAPVASDPQATPYVKKMADVERIFVALPEPVNVAYALGAFAGLRTGEILALDWARDVNLKAGRLHVQLQVKDGKLAELKDKESRSVPILAPLRPVLAGWHLKSGGKGLVVPPLAPKRGRRGQEEQNFTKPHTLHAHLAEVITAAKLPEDLTWYRATRHTFASHFVLNGGPVAILSKILGHSSVQVTERYAHLAPSAFPAELVEVFDDVRLGGRGRIAGTIGPKLGRVAAGSRSKKGRKS